MFKRVLITGSAGKCGSALLELPYEIVSYDRAGSSILGSVCRHIVGDILDLETLLQAMEGCDSVVHMAAAASLDSSWDDVARNNVEGTRCVLDAARKTGVKRVVFGSTNHVVGMYELDNAPMIYEKGYGILIDKDAPPRPDSYYGASKVYCEALGRYYAENGGPNFYSIRIGAVRTADDDHPYAYAENGVCEGKWERGSVEYDRQVKRLKALWLSRRDLLQLVKRCIEHKVLSFDVFYGVSENDARWLDIEYAKRVLGYSPQDNGALWLEKPAGENR